MPASVSSTDASRQNTVFITVNGKKGDHEYQNVYVCRQATPDVALQILDVISASAGLSATSDVTETQKKQQAEAVARLSAVFEQDNFELTTPIATQYMEAALQGFCELSINTAGNLNPADALEVFKDILTGGKEVALAEIQAKVVAGNIGKEVRVTVSAEDTPETTAAKIQSISEALKALDTVGIQKAPQITNPAAGGDTPAAGGDAPAAGGDAPAAGGDAPAAGGDAVLIIPPVLDPNAKTPEPPPLVVEPSHRLPPVIQGPQGGPSL